MITNYSVNNTTPSFGAFVLHAGANELLKKKLKTPEMLHNFTRLSHIAAERENDIYVSNVGSRLSANVGDGIWKTQGFFQNPVSFLEKMLTRADAYDREMSFKRCVEQAVDKVSKK